MNAKLKPGMSQQESGQVCNSRNSARDLAGFANKAEGSDVIVAGLDGGGQSKHQIGVACKLGRNVAAPSRRVEVSQEREALDVGARAKSRRGAR